MSRLRPALLTLAMIVGLTASMATGRSGAVTRARMRTPLPLALSASTECEGDACSQVTVTYDESKQQYHAQNNSAEQWVHVSASNAAASASVCLAPSKSDSLPLKSVVGPYHAEYSEPRCGAPPVP